MAQKHGLEKIDLSGLPEALRQKVQMQLSQMTPEKQQEFLQKATPMLKRAINTADNIGANEEGLRAALQKARMAPHGHYNQTIRPGDRNSFSLWRFLGMGLVSYIVYYVLSSS